MRDINQDDNFQNSILVEIWTSRLGGRIFYPKIACTPDPGLPVLSSGSQDDQPIHFNLDLLKNQEASMSLHIKAIDTTHDNFNVSTSFKIEQGSFYETVIPESAKSLWGPVPLGKLAEGKENICNAVSHK